MIKIRPLRIDDWRASVAWRNDTSIRRMLLSHPLPVTGFREEQWVKSIVEGNSRDRVVMGIENDQILAGYVYLIDIDWVSRHAEFAIVIGEKSTHRHGIGRAAASAMFKYAFFELNLTRLFVRVAAYNEPALRFFRSLGFMDEGLLREHIWMDGEYHHMRLLGLLSSEWSEK